MRRQTARLAGALYDERRRAVDDTVIDTVSTLARVDTISQSYGVNTRESRQDNSVTRRQHWRESTREASRRVSTLESRQDNSVTRCQHWRESTPKASRTPSTPERVDTRSQCVRAARYSTLTLTRPRVTVNIDRTSTSTATSVQYMP